jgi:hypothetical protein
LIALRCGFDMFECQKLLFVLHFRNLVKRQVAEPTESSL